MDLTDADRANFAFFGGEATTTATAEFKTTTSSSTCLRLRLLAGFLADLTDLSAGGGDDGFGVKATKATDFGGVASEEGRTRLADCLSLGEALFLGDKGIFLGEEAVCLGDNFGDALGMILTGE